MRISDWSSDVCSSDLRRRPEPFDLGGQQPDVERHEPDRCAQPHRGYGLLGRDDQPRQGADPVASIDRDARPGEPEPAERPDAAALSKRTARSEEHTSELQSLMRISYAVFCLEKKKHNQNTTH